MHVEKFIAVFVLTEFYDGYLFHDSINLSPRNPVMVSLVARSVWNTTGGVGIPSLYFRRKSKACFEISVLLILHCNIAAKIQNIPRKIFFQKFCGNKKKCIFAAESEIVFGCRFCGFDEGVGR